MISSFDIFFPMIPIRKHTGRFVPLVGSLGRSVHSFWDNSFRMATSREEEASDDGRRCLPNPKQVLLVRANSPMCDLATAYIQGRDIPTMLHKSSVFWHYPAFVRYPRCSQDAIKRRPWLDFWRRWYQPCTVNDTIKLYFSLRRYTYHFPEEICFPYPPGVLTKLNCLV